MYWPTSIKDTIKWSPFLTIMEHTANILKPKQGIVTSLLKDFPMLEFCLIDDRGKVGAIAISCINREKETCLYLENSL